MERELHCTFVCRILNRVSLCGCRVREQSPSRNVVFYVGDRVEGTDNSEIERLSQPRNIASILVSKLGPSINAWIIEPSHYNSAFACYNNLLPSLTSKGEPKGYDPKGLPAARATLTLLQNCLAQVLATCSFFYRDSVNKIWYYRCC